MAQPQDIRRESGDVSPNNFINPGVRDNSLGDLLKGVSEGAMAIDKNLALERFGEAAETLRSQYLVSDPATMADTQDLAEEAAEEEVEDIPTVSVGEDKHALKDFASQLDRNALARDQGVMSNDAFRLRAERLYRIAVMRRPGLAADLRERASSILGFDVVGSAIDIRKETEAAMLAASGKTAKDAKEASEWTEKEQRKMLEEAGFTEHSIMPLGSPAFKQYFEQTLPALTARRQAKVQVDMAKQMVDMQGANATLNEGANTATWLAQANAISTGVYPAVEQIQGRLKAAGESGNPVAIRQAFTQAQDELDRQVASLEAAASSNKIPADVVARQMAKFAAHRDAIASVLDNSDDAEVVKNYNSVLTGTKMASLLNDDEFLTYTQVIDAMGPAAPQLMAKMEKSLVLLAGKVLQNNAAPDVVTKNAGDMVAPLVGTVFARGIGTPADPKAVEKLSLLLDNAAQSFYLVNDSDFRLENFTGSTSKPGFLSSLNLQMKTLEKGLTEEQKLDLGMSVAAATANAIRVAGSGIQQDAPGIKGKFLYDYTPVNGRVFLPKPGEVLTAQQTATLAKYNRAFNTPLIESVISKLTGEDSPGVWQTVGASYRPVMEQRQKAVQARAASTQGGSGSPGATGLRGPSSRWWEQ
jgi:hypothetical protein